MNGSPVRLALLDRDGTIIVERGFPKEPDEVELIPGSAAAIRRLRSLGLRAVVVSNQSGIGRGFLTRDDVERVNARLLELLAAEGTTLDAVLYCPHAPEDGCACRKPQRTLPDRAASEFGADLARSFFVGDKRDDVDAGRNVGATTFLVRTGYGEQQDFPGRARARFHRRRPRAGGDEDRGDPPRGRPLKRNRPGVSAGPVQRIARVRGESGGCEPGEA